MEIKISYEIDDGASGPLKVWDHCGVDWCHICGEQKNELADIAYAQNAEHGYLPKDRYLRMCVPCAKRVADCVEKMAGSVERGKRNQALAKNLWTAIAARSTDKDKA